MLAPGLHTGIEEGHRFLRCGINGSCGDCFAEVAGRTGKTQIRGIIATLRVDMLNVHRLTDRRLTRLAVFTAMPCPLVDKTGNRGPG